VTVGTTALVAYLLVAALSICQLVAILVHCAGVRRNQTMAILAASQLVELILFRSIPLWRIFAMLQIFLSNSDAIRESFGLGDSLIDSFGALDRINDAVDELVTKCSLGVPLASAAGYWFSRNAFAPIMLQGHAAQLGRERFSKSLSFAACCFAFASCDRKAPAVSFGVGAIRGVWSAATTPSTRGMKKRL
jgi:hypothetical protein